MKKSTFFEICDSLILYVAILNHRKNAGEQFVYKDTRDQVFDFLFALKTEIAKNQKQQIRLKQLYLSLMFFVDFMIVEMKLDFSDHWDENRIAYEEKEMTGDEKFFSIAESFFENYDEISQDSLKVVYSCIMVGFSGMYKEHADQLQLLIDKIIIRIPTLKGAAIPFEDVYKNVDNRKLFNKKWVVTKRALLKLFCSLTGIWVFVDTVFYFTARHDFLNLLLKIKWTF